MSRRGLTFLVAGLLTAVLAILASVLPVPYVVLVPGPVTDTLGAVGGSGDPVIGVKGAKTYPTSGHLFLTTVGIKPANYCTEHPKLLQTLRAWFDSTEAVQPQQALCAPNESGDAAEQEQQQDMLNSQHAAVIAALLYLHYKPTHETVSVADVTPHTSAASVLKTGDDIVAVGGTTVTSTDQLRRLVTARPAGSTLALTIERSGKRKDVSVKTFEATDGTHRTLIGINLDISKATFAQPQVKIGISPEQVGGPSAGLAFTLAIIDKLTPGDLTGGRTVAGTGTITGTGQVGPIGGIQQKIAAAVKEHATVFLAPADDCLDAKAAAPDSLTLVKVDTLSTAVAALKAITSGIGTFPRC